ncbi:MAG: tetratricopeptide repeat protein [Candidatus Nitronauta litoralis]|uniref:Tetratricopeptide repeat protein n=1 Tax=Candidatus Nitronauta litoralis TaxID=2705533 RepID=A0A7T0BZ74_9BACT|nr:MAG: tetratricopeptide repeat protein [Candidatus Nitronauta litoralis]
MKNTKGSENFWFKALAILVLMAGTFLFFKENYFQNKGWEFHREAAKQEYLKGNLAEAERYLLKALEDAEKFEAGDPRLHGTLNSLLSIYSQQSKLKESEKIILKMLALDEQLLGADHPNVGASWNNLAENYRSQALDEKAKVAYEKAIKIFEKRFGPDHALVAQIRDRYKSHLQKD